jgi:hypothetical protein
MISHVIKKNIKCVHRIKCVKVRALFEKNKVRFANADQLWNKPLDRVGGAKRPSGRNNDLRTAL